jgi:hypothetical protein
VSNNLTGKREQLNTFFSFPEDLELTRFVAHAVEPMTYELFLVHAQSGSTLSGYHFAFIRADPGTSGTISTIPSYRLPRATSQSTRISADKPRPPCVRKG